MDLSGYFGAQYINIITKISTILHDPICRCARAFDLHEYYNL